MSVGQVGVKVLATDYEVLISKHYQWITNYIDKTVGGREDFEKSKQLSMTFDEILP